MKTLLTILALAFATVLPLQSFADDATVAADPALPKCPQLANPADPDVGSYVFNNLTAKDACFCSFSESWNGCLDDTVCKITYGVTPGGMRRFYNLTASFSQGNIVSNCQHAGDAEQIGACQTYFAYYSVAAGPMPVKYRDVTKTITRPTSCDYNAAITLPTNLSN